MFSYLQRHWWNPLRWLCKLRCNDFQYDVCAFWDPSLDAGHCQKVQWLHRFVYPDYSGIEQHHPCKNRKLFQLNHLVEIRLKRLLVSQAAPWMTSHTDWPAKRLPIQQKSCRPENRPKHCPKFVKMPELSTRTDRRMDNLLNTGSSAWTPDPAARKGTACLNRLK